MREGTSRARASSSVTSSSSPATAERWSSTIARSISPSGAVKVSMADTLDPGQKLVSPLPWMNFHPSGSIFIEG